MRLAAAAAATAAVLLAARPASAVGPIVAAWPFSWDTLPVFAFPGAAPRFMTPNETGYFTSNFANILIWGLNASCVGADGAPEPASCPEGASHCWCDQAHPESQQWVLNMEESLQAQGVALKAAAGPGAFYPTLGYIEYLSAQQYYKNQAAMWTNSSLVPLMLSVESRGLIDCYKDGCDWQGTEYRQYDLRQPAMRDYYVNDVILGLVSGPGLDGTFLDSIDWWATSACAQWPCTAQEAADLTNASLLTLEASLAATAAIGKVLSVSSHTTLTVSPDYYHAQIDLLAAAGNGIRFWEFWKPDEDCLTTLLYETTVLGLPTHVHTPDRTLSPDWVELAVFLLGMGDHSYFSYSGPWNLDSFAVMPEFTRPLGAPLGDAVNASKPVNYAAWELVPAQNFVYGWPSAPNASIPGQLAALGPFPNASACLAAVRANASFNAMTWAGPAEGEWKDTCWGRLDAWDAQACVTSENDGPPCYAAAEPGAVSAAAVPLVRAEAVWTRSFEHLDVTWSTATGDATLAWH
jgi:hypothetical protein